MFDRKKCEISKNSQNFNVVILQLVLMRGFFGNVDMSQDMYTTRYNNTEKNWHSF